MFHLHHDCPLSCPNPRLVESVCEENPEGDCSVNVERGKCGELEVTENYNSEYNALKITAIRRHQVEYQRRLTMSRIFKEVSVQLEP